MFPPSHPTQAAYPGQIRDYRDGRGMQTYFAERPVGELRPGDHAWLAFASGEERERVVGTFVSDGLATEEKVVYVSDSDPGGLPGVRSAAGADPSAYLRTGQLCVLPRERACLTRGRFDPDRLLSALDAEVSRAFDQGFRAVRITTDFSWALREISDRTLVLGCEDQFGAAVAPSTMAMAICQVDRHACPQDELIALRNTHEVLVEVNPEYDDGVLRLVRTFEPHGLRVEGELDAARHTVFAETLSAVTAPRRPVHLDLSRLRFIDLAALNLLVHFAIRLPRGTSLVLDHLPPDVESVIEMVGWYRLPGLARGRGGA